MSVCSNQLELEQATPGMTLSEPLYDAKGGVLLPQGATLTEGTLSALRRRGIETIAVLCEHGEEPAADTETEAARELARQRIGKLFRRCGAADANGLALQYVTRYRTGKNA